MKVSGPIIISQFLASPHADLRKRNTGMDFFDAVFNVSWFQMCGQKEMYISERWKRLQPNMWLATSRKK